MFPILTDAQTNPREEDIPGIIFSASNSSRAIRLLCVVEN